MIQPVIDARIAERLRDIATSQTDSEVTAEGITGILPADEKARILNIAADLLEEYIMAWSERQ